MKRFTFLVALFLLAVNATSASSVNATDVNYNRFDNNNPIEFNERGISFFVFPNGQFDFNTRPQDSQGDFFFRAAGRRGSITIESRRPENYGVLIENDSFGRVRRVGNTFINYDAYDRVNRIGSVFMRYNRFALIQIGGMQLEYNRFGDIVNIYGSVFGRRNYGYVNSPYDCNTNYGYSYNHHDNDCDNDDNYHGNSNGGYYYKGKKEDKEFKKEQKELRKEEKEFRKEEKFEDKQEGNNGRRR